MAERIYIFKGFERFWHWTQALLIMVMLATGFEVHGAWKLLVLRARRRLCT
jgi:thiosulfate reductase cytochrome b subunit